MMTTTPWTERTVAVIGAGRSGVAAAELLVRVGARVRLTDLRPRSDVPGCGRLQELGVDLVLGGHPDSLWSKVDSVVVSPGIPRQAPALRAARERGLEMRSEIELAASLATAPALAVTGSNGKSTVTSMVGAILTEAGLQAPVCGNIGVPFSRVVKEQLDGLRTVDLYVLELSSFQTETLVDFHPRWAGVLNISPDHLDRHGELRAYVQAKLRLLRNCGDGDWVVYGADDPLLSAELRIGGATPVPFSARPIGPGPAAWIQDDWIHWRSPDHNATPVMACSQLRVLGRHNALNAAAATALACLAGATPEAAAAALGAFPGLEHRMEHCGMVAGVACINDSKATNVGATEAALSGLDGGVWLILGGRDKGSDFAPLRAILPGRVRRVLLVGEASGKIAAALRGTIPLLPCGDLERAVDTALADASPGDLLLLAPACTSFDQYEDFGQRGRHFKALVAARAGDRSALAVAAPTREE